MTPAHVGTVLFDSDDETRLHLTLAGEVDLAVVTDDVRNRVSSSRATRATVNVADVTFLDSVALGLLVQLRNKTTSQPTLVGSTHCVDAVLAVAGLTQLFDHES